MAEYYIEDNVVAAAEADGWFSRKLQWVGRDGAPDRLFVKLGRVVFIEFKDKDKICDVMALLDGVTVHAPVRTGDVIVPNLFGTGVSVIACKSM